MLVLLSLSDREYRFEKAAHNQNDCNLLGMAGGGVASLNGVDKTVF